MRAAGTPVDIVIAGGGQVGLSLALALRRASPDLSVLVATGPATDGPGEDGRAFAVAAAGRRMLSQLGVWPEIAADAQAIEEMIVTDSRARDAVRPVLLSFIGTAEDGEPFAHMAMSRTMIGVLARAAREAGAEIVEGAGVADFAATPSKVDVELDDGRRLAARLLVAADGGRSRLRSLAGIGVAERSYRQAGIVATIAHEKPHHGRAEEHFLPAGPFAYLPLKGNRGSLVWTEESEAAARLVSDRLLFQVELERRIGHRLGAIETIGKPRAFPLRLALARRFVGERLALAGDAAHSIHPIAGQGLNLGFRDVAALCETAVEAHRLGLDPGSGPVLERYERWRRFDTVEMGLVTDALNRLFSSDDPLRRLVRDVGLGVVDRLPAVKRLFMREAAGEGGAAPRLLKGEAV